jgi:hypothetical protein
MNNLLKIEELALFIASVLLFSFTAFEWWWFLALLLLPDIGMLGYLAGTKVGAFTYNIFHHRALAIIVLLLGWYFKIPWLELAGIILFAHIAMDRVFGYGLKFSDSFHHTHLGWLKPPAGKSS